MKNRQHGLSALRTAAPRIAVCALVLCTACSNPPAQRLGLVIDLSEQSKGGFRTGPSYVDMLDTPIFFESTSSNHSEVDRDWLRRMADRMTAEPRMKISTVGSTAPRQDVYYCSHNLDSVVVVINFETTDNVIVNGVPSPQRALELAPGAHGFHIDKDDSSFVIEHEFVALSRSDSTAE